MVAGFLYIYRWFEDIGFYEFLKFMEILFCKNMRLCCTVRGPSTHVTIEHLQHGWSDWDALEGKYTVKSENLVKKKWESISAVIIYIDYLLQWSSFSYIGFNKMYYLNECHLCLFLLFNVTIRKFKISYVACIIFLYDSTALHKDGLCHESVKAMQEESIHFVGFGPLWR